MKLIATKRSGFDRTIDNPSRVYDNREPYDNQTAVGAPVDVTAVSESSVETQDARDALLRIYAERAARHWRLEQMENGRWFADIAGLQGVWSEGSTSQEAVSGLVDAVYGWVSVKVAHGDKDIPPIDGIDLNDL